MCTDPRLIVHFSCPHCATVYTAGQEQRPGRHPGDFYCRECGTPVHSWTGLYNFADWKPVTIPEGRSVLAGDFDSTAARAG